MKKEKEKSKKGKGIKTMCWTQIILLVSMSFALAFLLSDNFASAAPPVPRPGQLIPGINSGAPSAAIPNTLGLNSEVTGFSSGVGQTLMGNLFRGTGGWGSFGAGAINSVITGAIYAGIWASVGAMIGSLFGLDSSQVSQLTTAMAIGGAAQGISLAIFSATGALTGAASWFVSLGIGLFITAIIFLFSYKKKEVRTVDFVCEPWQAPKGGANCQQCNKDANIPCTEYRCKSLGSACMMINSGSAREACVANSTSDAISPKITPWAGALIPKELSYTVYGSRPPELGTKIVDSRTPTRCIQPFSAFEFGVSTDEPAKCFMSWNHTATMDEMPLRFKESVYLTYNHSTKMALPNEINRSDADLAPMLQNDGTFTLFVRCADANGNLNVDEYAINFCVDPSPDSTPPIIEGFSITSGNPVAYGTNETPIDAYTNEPADCRWSKLNQGFATMENTMTCANDVSQINPNLQYACSGKLKGIGSSGDNKFYFSCNDTKGNVMPTAKEFILKSSQQLSISDITPSNGTTIKGGASIILANLEVKTDDGAENGKAWCKYKAPDYAPKDYQLMFETGTSDTSRQAGLQLPPGNYTYYISCTDIGGNTATGIAKFNVFSDTTSPQVTRVYKTEPSSLKVVTNEDAECVYSAVDCDYAMSEGTALTYLDLNNKKIHLAPWQSGKTYYVKCKDEFGNEPSANDCNVIAKMV